MTTDEYITEALTKILKAIKNQDESRLVSQINALKFLIHMLPDGSVSDIVAQIMTLVTSPNKQVQRTGVEIIKDLGISAGDFAAHLTQTISDSSSSHKRKQSRDTEATQEQSQPPSPKVQRVTTLPASRAAGMQQVPDMEETDDEGM